MSTIVIRPVCDDDDLVEITRIIRAAYQRLSDKDLALAGYYMITLFIILRQGAEWSWSRIYNTERAS